ncbi:MAG: cyanophycin synthetase, partial [Gammaproteobacteria bacterium]
RPVCGRLQSKRGPHGSRLLDDSYNANPASLQAALDVLADFEGKRWLVLGDMGELGSAAANLHESVGSLARKAGVEQMYAIGDLSRLAAKTFGKGAHHYEQADQLITALAAGLHEDVTVLIKGSRSMHMEQVVASLAEGN